MTHWSLLKTYSNKKILLLHRYSREWLYNSFQVELSSSFSRSNFSVKKFDWQTTAEYFSKEKFEKMIQNLYSNKVNDIIQYSHAKNL